MIVLGFDTATPATAVALRLADGHALQARDEPGPGERPGHATRLLGLVDGLLVCAGLRFDQLDRIAVGVGPGTFTGLRVGLATARGLAQSLSLELVGVSSLHALALAVPVNARVGGTIDPARHDAGKGGAAGVLSVLDARRGEAFVAAYAPRTGGTERVQLGAPRALAPGALGEALQAARERADTERWIAVGDGAVRFGAELAALALEVPADDSSLHSVSGQAICELALSAQPQPLEAVLPDYCRRPDAELALERAAATAGVAA
jgi:tRNA threonylcarbamoyladenosine biosynthesis protein TsaB